MSIVISYCYKCTRFCPDSLFCILTKMFTTCIVKYFRISLLVRALFHKIIKCIYFLAHLTQRVRWAIAITWRPSYVVNFFQKSSPLKVLDQWKPNLVWIITRVSSFKIVSGDAVHQQTWPLLLKIEHMVKLQVFGNNSKTVNNIKHLTG